MHSWGKAHPKIKWLNMHSSSQHHLPAILRPHYIMQQKLKAEIPTAREPSWTLGIDQRFASLIFKSNFTSTTLAEPPFEEGWGLLSNLNAKSSKVHKHTSTIVMLESYEELLWANQYALHSASRGILEVHKEGIRFHILPFFKTHISLQFQYVFKEFKFF